MYHYIIDQSRLPAKNIDRFLGQAYELITQYQISGEVHRVTKLRNIPELVEQAILSHAKTIIAIGDDQSFLQLVQILAENESMVIGYIPLISDSEISNILGLGNLSDACKAIAQRRVEEFDLGLVGRTHFFSKIEFGYLPQLRKSGERLGFFGKTNLVNTLSRLTPLPVNILVDRNYKVTAQILAGKVVNTQPGDKDSHLIKSSDDKLDLVLLSKINALSRYKNLLAEDLLEEIPGATVLHAKEFQIESPGNLGLIINSIPVTKNAVTVSVSPYKIKTIVGKGRKS